MISPNQEEWAQLAFSKSPYCRTCSEKDICGEHGTARGCLEEGPRHPNLLHPTTPDWLPRLAQVNGLDLQTVEAVAQDIPSLPRYVPRIRLNTAIKEHDRDAAVALSLREVERLAATVRSSGFSAKTLLGLPADSLLLVLGFEEDAFLERAWSPARRRQLLTAMAEIRPDLAVAWGYSVWYRHVDGWLYPRVEQLYSIKRSLVTFQNLQGLGIPAIPHVYWGSRDDLDRWVCWLAANSSVRAIAVDLQTADSAADWQAALQGLAYLRQTVARGLRLFVNGPCGLRRLWQLDEVWPGCSVSNFGAYFSSLYPRKAMYDLQATWTDFPGLSRQAVFDFATREFTELIANAGSRRHFALSWRRERFVQPTTRGSLPSKVRRVRRPVQLELPLGDRLLVGVA